MNIKLTFTGGAEIQKTLEGLSRKVAKQVTIDALTAAAAPIRDAAAQKAPRAPGAPDLADHIGVAPVKPKRSESPTELSVAIGVPNEFFYDFFLEYGTRFISARPFYRPALDSQASTALEVLRARYWEAIASQTAGTK
jgi:HK97 gp10 family phage protein